MSANIPDVVMTTPMLGGRTSAKDGPTKSVSHANVPGKRQRSNDIDDPWNDCCCVEATLRELERGTLRGLYSDPVARRYENILLQDPLQYLLPRLERSFWKRLSTTAKERIGWCLQELLGHHAWRFIGLTCDLPLFEEATTGLQFTLIPGGTYRIGMSLSAKDQLLHCLLTFHGVSHRHDLPRESVQVQKALFLIDRTETGTNYKVEPFLLATTPIPLDHAITILQQWHDHENNCPVLSNVTSSGSTHQVPYRFRLPTEGEWEYAARGGGWDIVFPYNCQIVSTATSVTTTTTTTKEMQQRRDPSCVDPRNTLGLRQVGVWPEVCVWEDDDHHHYHHLGTHAPTLVARSGSEMWSLIHHAHPVSGGHRLGCTYSDVEVHDSMMITTNKESGTEKKVVRLAVDIVSSTWGETGKAELLR